MANTQIVPRNPPDGGIYVVRPYVQRVSPLTGATIVVPGADAVIIVTPAGTIAALTIQFPATGLLDGNKIELGSSQIITALTFTGATVLGAPAAVPQAFGNAGFIWSEADTVWYRYR